MLSCSTGMGEFAVVVDSSCPEFRATFRAQQGRKNCPVPGSKPGLGKPEFRRHQGPGARHRERSGQPQPGAQAADTYYSPATTPALGHLGDDEDEGPLSGL